MTKLTNQQLLDICNDRYFLRDGILYSKKTNAQLGCVGRDGYLKTMIYVDGSRFNITVHRIVYLMVYGNLPEFIDHINGDRRDNRIENLRPATKSENSKNRLVSKNSTSGSKGVIYNKRSTKPWNARIRTNGKMRSLGYYHTIEEATAVYQKAALEYHGEYASHTSRSDS